MSIFKDFSKKNFFFFFFWKTPHLQPLLSVRFLQLLPESDESKQPGEPPVFSEFRNPNGGRDAFRLARAALGSDVVPDLEHLKERSAFFAILELAHFVWGCVFFLLFDDFVLLSLAVELFSSLFGGARVVRK